MEMVRRREERGLQTDTGRRNKKGRKKEGRRRDDETRGRGSQKQGKRMKREDKRRGRWKEERKLNKKGNVKEMGRHRRWKRKRSKAERHGRLEWCPNPSWLTETSATHLLPCCPPKLLLASYQRCRLEGKNRDRERVSRECENRLKDTEWWGPRGH